jgi:Protein of unknown function (DUF2630)
MPTTARKTELSPLEAILVELQLGDEARKNPRDGALARIQQLTKERQRLYAKSAAHPILAPANGARIRQLAAEIDLLWELLRRERATRRVQIERRLNVRAEDDDERRERPAPESAIDAA